jgi:hypothetical protein
MTGLCLLTAVYGLGAQSRGLVAAMRSWGQSTALVMPPCSLEGASDKCAPETGPVSSRSSFTSLSGTPTRRKFCNRHDGPSVVLPGNRRKAASTITRLI